MARSLEFLERMVIGHGPRLIDNILGECKGPDAVRLVRKVVGLSSHVNGGVDFIVNSIPWAKFALLYPGEVRGILCDAANGSIDSE
jgi:hypothetical protein